jgi:transposase
LVADSIVSSFSRETLMIEGYFWLNDAQWAKIAPLLPRYVRGKHRVDDRKVLSGIIQVIVSGCRWSDAPLEYGPRKTLYNRFVRWAVRGVWEEVFMELARQGGPPAEALLDSTHIKVHRCASGGRRKKRGIARSGQAGVAATRRST